MFPDISCDDIFRLETERLWLRWLRASDASALGAICGLREVAQMTATIPHPYPPGEAERFILGARAATAAGDALILALTLKNKGRTLVGLATAQVDEAGAPGEIEIGYFVAPAHGRQGYATEATGALADAVFNLTEARALNANTRADNEGSRRVLEACGFLLTGTGMKVLPARGGLHECAFFRRDRAGWARNRRRRLPGMTHQPMRRDG